MGIKYVIFNTPFLYRRDTPTKNNYFFWVQMVLVYFFLLSSLSLAIDGNLNSL